ncbi:MAG: magnesium-translocating P-type ATPase, partial [Gammaproteobacteria bacterium]
LMLPFLPMLPKQVLATNLLTDLPVMTIPSDAVDPEWVHTPRRWDLPFIKRFMVVFGLLSSAFDFLTFAVLLYGFHASAEVFWSGWFLVSVLTEIVILWILRTRRPAWRSRPGRWLLWSSLATAAFTLALPYTPFGADLPPTTVLILLGVVILYGIANEVTKRWFYRHVSLGTY